MAYGSITFERADKAEVHKEGIEGAYPRFMVTVGGCSLHIDHRAIDVAEQVARCLLEGVAAMREHIVSRDQVPTV